MEDVSDWHVDVSLLLAVVKLCALDDDQVGGEVDPPCHSRRGNQHLDALADKQLLDGLPVSLDQAGVVHPDPEGQGQPEVLVLDGGKTMIKELTQQQHYNTTLINEIRNKSHGKRLIPDDDYIFITLHI